MRNVYTKFNTFIHPVTVISLSHLTKLLNHVYSAWRQPTKQKPLVAKHYTGLNILLEIEYGLDDKSGSLFSSVTSVTSTRFRRFSTVLTKTLSFKSLEKSFSKELLALVLFCMLISINCLYEGNWMVNSDSLHTSLISCPRSM